MVTVSDVYERENGDGTKYHGLVLMGEPEMVQSPKTGMFYASASKAYVYSTLPLEQCHALIGKQFPGQIVKEECVPYEYKIPETGEVIELDYTYKFVKEESPQKKVKKGAEAG